MFKDPRPVRFLVVEDNTGDFTLISEYLCEQFSNADMIHAASYHSAKKQLDNHIANYDVILLDLTLPDRSGELLIADVCALSHDSVVIVLTGNPDIDLSVRALALGASDYLVKDDINAATLYKS